MPNHEIAIGDAPALPPSVFRAEAPSMPRTETTIGELIGILRRHKLLIFATSVVLTLLPTLYGLLLETRYTAVASVLLEPEIREIVTGEQLQPVAPDAAALETQVNLIRSRSLAEQTMEELNLFRDPEFMLDADYGRPLWQRIRERISADDSGASAAKVRQRAAKRLAQTRRQSEVARRTAIETFMSNLDVRQAGASHVLEIAFTSIDPKKAAAVANRVAEHYVQGQLKRKIKETEKTKRWLASRLRAEEQKMLDAERRVASFRAGHPLPSRSPALGQGELLELKRELIRTMSAQAEASGKIALVKAARSRGRQTEALAEITNSPVISQLRLQEAELKRHEARNAAAHGPDYPTSIAIRDEVTQLTAQADREVSRVLAGLRNEANVLADQAGSLQRQLAAAERRTSADDAAAVRLQQLESDAVAQRTHYAMLLGRFQETSGRQNILEPDARIISAAVVPLIPSTPSPLSFAGIGFGASVLFGCFLALVREQTNRKLRSTHELERELLVPCVGMVPDAELPDRSGALHDAVRQRPRSFFSQAVRSLHAQLTSGASPPQCILVASALPEEGKTTLAAGLAVCAAQDGARTLLVDFDLWRPQVAHSFGIDEPCGLNVVMHSQDPLAYLEQSLITDDATGIHILPAGQPSDAVPWLARQRLKLLLDALRQRYDRIIIDSPPLLATSDGRILAACADATLFVVRWERTDRDAAAAALRILQDTSTIIIGTVLSRVDLRKHATYGQHYQSSVLQYYAN